MPQFKSDLDVIKALRSHQSSAIRFLYDNYATQMYTLALRILNNTQEAEDLIQEIFLGLWKNCTFDPERGTLRTFLLILVRSRALDRLRSRKSAHALLQREEQTIPPSSIAPMEAIVADENSEKLRAAIAQLPTNQRQAIELAYFEGYSQSEIAQEFSVPLGTVKSWFRLGFSKLRSVLKEDI